MSDPLVETYVALDEAGHADFPAEPAPEGTSVVVKSQCSGCPQVNLPGHKSCARMVWPTGIPREYRLQTQMQRAIQDRIELVHRMCKPMAGVGTYTSSYYQPIASNKLADSIQFKVLNATGRLLELEPIGGGDPGDMVIFQRDITPDGFLYPCTVDFRGLSFQPFDMIIPDAPSVMAHNAWPLVVRVAGLSSTAILVETNQDVSNIENSGDVSNPSPEYMTLTRWRQAGDLPRYYRVHDPWHNLYPDICAHAIHDKASNVLSGDGTDVETLTIDGQEVTRRWYCAARKLTLVTFIDDGRNMGYPVAIYTDVIPSQVGTFACHCSQTGCSGYSRLATSGIAMSVRDRLSAWLRQTWGCCNIKVVQIEPGFPYYTIERVDSPSIVSNFGGPVWESPRGFHQQADSPDWGIGLVKDLSTVTDAEGNTRLARVKGAFEQVGYVPASWDDPMQPGVIPSLVAGWDGRKDPFEASFTAGTDPTACVRYHEHRQSISVAQDDGALRGRGAARWPREVDYPDVCPQIDVSDTSGWQVRGRMWFKRLASPVTVQGLTAGGLLYVQPLIQDGKGTPEIVSGTVVSASVDAGLIKVRVANGTHKYSFGDGAGGDTVVEWKGGGRFVRPADHKRVNCWYEPDKTRGGILDLASMGDAVYFTGATIAGIGDFCTLDAETERPHHLFTIAKALDHAGEQAASWESSDAAWPQEGVVTCPGYVTEGRGLRYDCVWLMDQNGALAANLGALAGATIHCLRNAQVSCRVKAPRYTEYQVDSYTAFSSGQYVWRAGSGECWLDDAVLAAMTAASYCWELVDV